MTSCLFPACSRRPKGSDLRQFCGLRKRRFAGLFRRADGGTRTPDPIITSVSGDAPGTPWPVCIGIFGGCPRPFALGATSDGTPNGRHNSAAWRSPRAVSSAHAPDWLPWLAPQADRPAVLWSGAPASANAASSSSAVNVTAAKATTPPPGPPHPEPRCVEPDLMTLRAALVGATTAPSAESAGKWAAHLSTRKALPHPDARINASQVRVVNRRRAGHPSPG
jgi:hypothetical protein